MGKNATDRDPSEGAPESVSRRAFLSKGAVGVGAVALTGVGAKEAKAQVKWDLSADVVIIGAGVAGLAAAITARDHGSSVINVDENYDIGGRGILSGDGSISVAATLCSRNSASRIRPTAFLRIGCATTPLMRDTATEIWSASLPTRTSRPIIF